MKSSGYEYIIVESFNPRVKSNVPTGFNVKNR